MTPPDEKVCPFCAETIKAAAIKCRYCGSELTPDAPVEPVETTPVEPTPDALVEPVETTPVEPTPDAPVEPVETTPVEPTPDAPVEPVETTPVEPTPVAAVEPVETTPVEPTPDAPVEPVETTSVPPTETTRKRRGLLLAAGLASAATAVVFAVLAVIAWQDARDLEAGESAARAVRATVADDIEKLLSYDHTTFDTDQAEAEELLTPSFREEYAPTAEAIKSAALEQRRTQQAEVVGVSVVSASPDRVEALVFVNTTTFTSDDERQRLMQNRIGVTVLRSDDGWLIDGVTFPQS